MKKSLSLNPPLICVGSPRSGTTMTLWFFQQVRDVTTMGELNTLWRTGNTRCPHDRFTAEMATDRIARRIRTVFLKHQSLQPQKRIFQKTPRNVFRIPFVHKVLPEARFLHIYRDGRDAVSSVLQYWVTPAPVPTAQLLDMLRHTPVRDWLAYAPRFFRDYVGIRLGLVKKLDSWGAAYPGMAEDLLARPLVEVLAKQWVEAVRIARQDLKQLDPGIWMELRYEDVVAHPIEQFGRVLDFIGVRMDRSYERYLAENVQPFSIGAHRRRLTPKQIATVTRVIRPMMSELGYKLESEPAEGKELTGASAR